ncbi:hypothetical protein [Streptomyces tendae]
MRGHRPEPELLVLHVDPPTLLVQVVEEPAGLGEPAGEASCHVPSAECTARCSTFSRTPERHLKWCTTTGGRFTGRWPSARWLPDATGTVE